MAVAAEIISSAGFVLSMIFGIVLLIAAFKKSAGTGFLSLCVPFYILYFAFAEYESPKKKIVLTLWLASVALMIFSSYFQ